MADKKNRNVSQKEPLVCGIASSLENEYSTYYKDTFYFDGSPTDYDLEEMFSNPQDNIADIVSYSKYCYRKYGVIMRLINMYRDFGCTALHLDYTEDNEKAAEVIKNYNKKVGLVQLVREMIFELAETGNLACYDRNGKRVDIYPIDQIEVVPYIVNNKQVIAYKINQDYENNDYDSKTLQKISKAYPKEVLKAQKSGNRIAILDIDKAYFAKINSSQYEKYGITVLLPAFEDLAHKNLLKAAEKSTATAIIDKIMLTQIGDKDNIPTTPLIQEYDKILQNMSGSISMTVPYYVNMKFIEPETAVFGAEKFIEIDKDILNTLGVSVSLLRGEGGGSYSDGIVNFTGLCKSIEAVRQPIIPIIEGLWKAELKRNKIDPRYAPSLRFEEVVIDKAAKTELLTKLFTEAGLPYELLYEGCGFDYDHVKLLRKKENDGDTEDTFKLHAQPFQGQQTVNDGGAPKKNDSERKTDKSKSNNKQARPEGKKKTGMK